ncbi:MAG TPA: hypothetical protein VGP08_21220 [Pyrinomonadaceae bacterium]|jgi:hypothetical protein|nr:hypothetical protein [Pyrinomonadaceae bacterium]
MFGAALFNLFDAEPVPAAAAAPAPPVDDKERIRQERALRDQARRAAAALRLQREEEAKLERIAFYRLAAPAAHDYIRTHSVQQITETKFSLKLFATYPSRHRYTRAITGYGGEYMFNPIGRDVLIANSVIHVHWDTKGGREYGHFKNHINKNVGGAVSGIASLGAIEEAKLDALGIPSVVSMLIIVDPKYYKEF